MWNGHAHHTTDELVSLSELVVACVFIPHFPLRVEILRHPELDGLPLAITDPFASLRTNPAGSARRSIADCSPEAAAQGMRVGMPLREAIGACPHAAILTSDPVHYANVFADLLGALGAVSPGIEAGEPCPERREWMGVAYVDLRGLERLWGGLDNLTAALLRAVPPALRPRLGLAANKFVARVAAEWARPGGTRIVPAAYSKAFLAGCPVDLLPVPAEMRRRLHQFGLYTLRDIARLPMAKLQAQFGPAGRRAWELAHGHDASRLTPLIPEERVTERLTLPAPSVQSETLLLGVRQLVTRLYTRPELRYRGARRARLQLLLEERRSWERTFMLKGVVGNPDDLFAALRYRLAGLALEGAVEELGLELAGLAPIYARQEELFDTGAHLGQTKKVREVVRELQSRYGRAPLYRAMRIEPWSRLPERRWGLVRWG
jgi:DNA polymerase-4/protein ImuB